VFVWADDSHGSTRLQEEKNENLKVESWSGDRWLSAIWVSPFRIDVASLIVMPA
jgi:hypothetical protein